MAPLMDSTSLKHENVAASALSSMLAVAASIAPLPFPLATTPMASEDDGEYDEMDTEDAAKSSLSVLELPAVVLEQIFAFVDHATLHTVEKTSIAFFEVVQRSGMSYFVCLCSFVPVEYDSY